jgi:hypothetical protein
MPSRKGKKERFVRVFEESLLEVGIIDYTAQWLLLAVVTFCVPVPKKAALLT